MFTSTICSQSSTTRSSDLLHRMALLEAEFSERDLGFKPKAIYVYKTNIADDGEKDDASKPFEHRQATPIRIWRYLVEEKGVLPERIAIYADLTFQREVSLTT